MSFKIVDVIVLLCLVLLNIGLLFISDTGIFSVHFYIQHRARTLNIMLVSFNHAYSVSLHIISHLLLFNKL